MYNMHVSGTFSCCFIHNTEIVTRSDPYGRARALLKTRKMVPYMITLDRPKVTLFDSWQYYEDDPWFYFSGLALYYNINRNEYIQGLYQEEGVRVVIHDPYIVPDVEMEGFDVFPGISTSIGFMQVILCALS